MWELNLALFQWVTCVACHGFIIYNLYLFQLFSKDVSDVASDASAKLVRSPDGSCSSSGADSIIILWSFSPRDLVARRDGFLHVGAV